MSYYRISSSTITVLSFLSNSALAPYQLVYLSATILQLNSLFGIGAIYVIQTPKALPNIVLVLTRPPSTKSLDTQLSFIVLERSIIGDKNVTYALKLLLVLNPYTVTASVTNIETVSSNSYLSEYIGSARSAPISRSRFVSRSISISRLALGNSYTDTSIGQSQPT